MIRVLLVDDQTLFLSGMKLLLEGEDDIQVVGGAADGFEAIDMVDRLRPDVVLMDIRMPRLDGVGATHRILMQHPNTQIVALTTFDDDQLVFDILREGAVGYLLKDADANQIIAAIRSAGAGTQARVVRPRTGAPAVLQAWSGRHRAGWRRPNARI